MDAKKIINISHLRGDFFGGLTAGVVALPLALAFGLQSGMGAIAGLYGAIAVGMIAAWFGGTPTQISGPTGPMTVVSAVVIASAIEANGGSLELAMGTIIAIFLLAGVFQILFGIFKIGKYIIYIPYPVVSGFMSGIGVIIIILQIFPFLGYISPKSITNIFSQLPNIIYDINIHSVSLSLATITTIYIFPILTKLIPSTLIALILFTICSTVMDLNVRIIGDIPEGLPTLKIEYLSNIDFSNPVLFIIPALTLAALGAIDSLLTSVVADNMTKTRHRSNKELIGQGLGNIGGALIGGIPGAGATMRTVVNINSGGKTRISGVIHSIALLIVLLGAGNYARLIPLPVLAGILITVGISIIDYKGLKHIFYVPKTDLIIMVVVLLMTVFVDLLQAVAMGIILASVFFMKKISDISVQDCVFDKVIIDTKPQQQIGIKHFSGPIFFGVASKFQHILSNSPQVTVVIIRMNLVTYIDQSGLYAFEDAVATLKKRGIVVLITGIQQQPKNILSGVGVIPHLIPEYRLFADFSQCMTQLEKGVVNLDIK